MDEKLPTDDFEIIKARYNLGYLIEKLERFRDPDPDLITATEGLYRLLAGHIFDKSLWPVLHRIAIDDLIARLNKEIENGPDQAEERTED